MSEQTPKPSIEAPMPLPPNAAPELNGDENIGSMEVMSRISTHAALAINGLSGALARVRMKNAGTRMERMDHKDALYSDLGSLALNGHIDNHAITATGEVAKPRSVIERHIDRKLDRKAQKKMVASIHAFRTENTFGPVNELRGSTKHQKRKASRLVSKDVRRGYMTATEGRIAKTEIGAEPVKIGAQLHKQTARELRNTTSVVSRAAKQPISSRWRSLRRKRAISSIKKHHGRAEASKQKQQELRALI